MSSEQVGSEVIDLMRAHRSVREYKSDPIPDELIRQIIRSAQWASTSHFRQTYSVLAIKNQEKKSQLFQLCGKQKWIIECPLFLVFLADMNRLEDVCKQYGKRVNLEHTETFLTAALDVGLVMQNTALAIESFGLGMVMIGGIRNHPSEINELLELPYGVFAVSGMCVGYPSKVKGQKPRLPLDEVLHWESYQSQGRSQRLEEYDQAIQEAEVYRRQNGQLRGWSEAMASNTSRPPLEGERMNIREVLREQGFELK